MKHGESKTQQAYVHWARYHPLAKRVYAVPNGGQRSKITAAIMKAEGALAGVPDLCLPVPAGGCHSLYVEFKHDDNSLTPAQREYAEWLVEQGHHVVVAWSAHEAVQHTLSYLRGEHGPGLVSLKPTKRCPIPAA